MAGLAGRTRANPGTVVRWVVAVLWLVIAVFPIWWMFNVVFTDAGVPIVTNPRLYPSSLAAGLQNIREVTASVAFLRSYLVSFAYAVVQIAGMLLVCSMAAYEFAFFRFPGRNALFAIALAALMVPQAVTVIPTYVIVVRLRWLNSIQGLAVPGMASAFGLFILRQFMETIPKELLAAAEIDGASHFGAYRRVALPLSSNALVTLSVLTFMSSWGSYLWPLIVSTKSAWFTVSLTVAKFIGSQSHFTINVVMTVAFLSSLPPIVFFFIFQRRIVEGVALTGLKG